MKKRGVSPIIATILLIVLVVIIGAIVFMWFRSMTQEAVIKFDKNIDLVCDEVEFDASYSNEFLIISNIGNVPIYDMNIKLEGSGSYETKQMRSYNEDGGLRIGSRTSISGISGYTKITLTPILLGLDDDGNEKTKSCDEGRHGKEIYL